MRRHYPPDQVDQMAQSIKENGVLQPCLAVPVISANANYNYKYWIVIGNLRLEGLRRLAEDAPLLPAIVKDDLVVDQQLLNMAIENAIRFDPDPISEGIHYQTILRQPDMNVNKLYQKTGVSPLRIQNRLLWAQLEPEIQQIVSQGQLPLGAVDHLIRLPAGQVRIETARRVARSRSSLRTIQSICSAVLNQLNRQTTSARSQRSPQGPALGHATATTNPQGKHDVDLTAIDERKKHAPLTRGLIRAAARAACKECPNHDTLGVSEPCWTILSHGTKEICQSCGLAAFRDVCIQCPLTMCLRQVYREMARKDGKSPHETF
jgi:ParB family chromosome partitioning protein